jgi:hypothetical protein
VFVWGCYVVRFYGVVYMMAFVLYYEIDNEASTSIWIGKPNLSSFSYS